MPDWLTLHFSFLSLMLTVCAWLLVAIYRCVFELVTLARVQDYRERQRESSSAPESR